MTRIIRVSRFLAGFSWSLCLLLLGSLVLRMIHGIMSRTATHDDYFLAIVDPIRVDRGCRNRWFEEK